PAGQRCGPKHWTKRCLSIWTRNQQLQTLKDRATIAMPNEALRISDVAFVVTSQIERAPHWTMTRELTMNAIEAAARASGEKTVHWTSGLYGGTREAVIRNTGPGMGPAEL